MRRALSLLLTAALLCCLMAACKVGDTAEGSLFYYLIDAAEAGRMETLFQTEQRQLDNSRPWKERIQMYLTGPVDDALRNPFPRDLTVLSAAWEESEQCITLRLSEEYTQLTGIGRTLANACLVWTLTEFDGIERVKLYCENNEDLMDGNPSLSRELFHSSANLTEKEHTLRIYFADENQRYLIPTTRKVVSSENLPIYVIYQLLEGPGEEGLLATMPKATRLLNFQLEDGIATVDFSSDFLTNRPRTELGERMTLYSLVNSLTELDGIAGVRLLVEGSPLEYYQYFRLPETLRRCETAIGPVRTGINEFDATLYYGSWSSEFLAAEPTRIVRDDTRSPGEQIVRALLDSEPANGLVNLMPAGTRLITVDMLEGICYIDVSKEFANIGGGYAAERQTVHALVASVCSINSIHSVVLTIEGGTVTLPNYDLSGALSPAPGWFFPS